MGLSFIAMGKVATLGMLSPCQPSPCCHPARYWPQVRVSRLNQGHTGELLRIEMTNPWAGLLFLNVRVAFVAADPNPCGQDGQLMVSFNPAKEIRFGDIAYSPRSGAWCSGVVRDIFLYSPGHGVAACQFYAGVCFGVLPNTGTATVQESYMLYKSGCLPRAR